MQGIQNIISATEAAFKELDPGELDPTRYRRVALNVATLISSLTHDAWVADNLDKE